MPVRRCNSITSLFLSLQQRIMGDLFLECLDKEVSNYLICNQKKGRE
jgi:hypothetical protein